MEVRGTFDSLRTINESLVVSKLLAMKITGFLTQQKPHLTSSPTEIYSSNATCKAERLRSTTNSTQGRDLKSKCKTPQFTN